MRSRDAGSLVAVRFGRAQEALLKLMLPQLFKRGRVAQLGERIVRNDEVVGSIPTTSTKFERVLRLPFGKPQGRSGFRLAAQTPPERLKFDPDHVHQFKF